MKLIKTLVMASLLSGLFACAADQPEHQVEATMPSPQVPVEQQPARAAQEQKLKMEISRLSAEKRHRPAPAQVFSDAAASPASIAVMPQSLITPPVGNTHNREVYAPISKNGVQRVTEQPVSTFSIDVDTGAYAVIRRYLNQGALPPGDAVRIEEMINYFDYTYAAPHNRIQPFNVHTEIAPSPWRQDSHLVRIGIQGYRPALEERKPANLVFLIDVSGSMNAPDKLPLLKNAFRLLTRQLDEQDKVTLVVYAGSSGVVLETTPGNRQGDILAALDRLSAGGSTHGSAGIQLAYDMAEQALIKDGVNRVILATDGDFNVGTVNHEALVDLIERKKHRGIALTTLGFGSGNYNDHLMEQLADHGDGNYAYIDSFKEARKVLVEQINGTLETIARDVKIQIEWNPALVSEYRLIGYENRVLQREDFNNDKVDAGDIGAGHTVTALYEITLAGQARGMIEPLRYAGAKSRPVINSDELGYIKLRYKQPGREKSTLMQRALLKSDIKPDHDALSPDSRFAAAVAAFGEQLRGAEHLGRFGYSDILELARGALDGDAHGYRGEFIGLVELAAALDARG